MLRASRYACLLRRAQTCREAGAGFARFSLLYAKQAARMRRADDYYFADADALPLPMRSTEIDFFADDIFARDADFRVFTLTPLFFRYFAPCRARYAARRYLRAMPRLLCGRCAHIIKTPRAARRCRQSTL